MKKNIFHKILQSASSRNDVVLALFLVTVIVIMILPMPTFIVDTLVAFNISFGIILLMTSVYINTPLAFSSFPAILLLTTLFRLALSVTTTRLILLQADAGDIITTFGDFVVGGNIVVGIIIFTIITLVQFVVITKGSERVAEVSARFSLDAMPGKQMSIDGDLRSGVIDAEIARNRRVKLQRESQLYGSMDGAMKFVKGDAIAGIFIILINIIGGISVGMIQKDMSIDTAGSVYTILTVGDGLIAQIPALFVSIAAGIVVTRVSSKEKRNLGDEIGIQMLAQPKALFIAAGVMAAFALVPGFPKIIFISFSLIFGLLAIKLSKREKSKEKEAGQFLKALNGNPGVSSDEDFSYESLPSYDQLSLNMSAASQNKINIWKLNQHFMQLRKDIFVNLGVRLPSVRIKFSHTLPVDNFEFMVHEIPADTGTIKPGTVLCTGSREILQSHKIPFQKSSENDDNVWVEEKYKDALTQFSIDFEDCDEVLMKHLEKCIIEHVGEFIGVQETSALLNQIKPDYHDLVKEINSSIPLTVLSDVLRTLVQEGISIRNLNAILEGVLKKFKTDKDPLDLAEAARIEIQRQISHKYCNGFTEVSAILLEAEVEEKIRSAIKVQQDGSRELLLDKTSGHKLVEEIKNVLDKNSSENDGARTILVTARDLRRFIRAITKLPFATLPILTYQELPQTIQIKPIGRIEI